MNFDIYQERKDWTFIISCAGVPSERHIHGFVLSRHIPEWELYGWSINLILKNKK